MTDPIPSPLLDVRERCGHFEVCQFRRGHASNHSFADSLATPIPSPDTDLRAAFRAELDRDEAVRAALHPVVCEADHDRQTASEHWRCVRAARTAINAGSPSSESTETTTDLIAECCGHEFENVEARAAHERAVESGKPHADPCSESTETPHE